MIEIIGYIFSMVSNFINWFFTLQIELSDGLYTTIGELVCVFVFFVLAIYLLFFTLKIVGED